MLVNGALALKDVTPTGFAFWQQGSSLRSNHAGTVHRMTVCEKDALIQNDGHVWISSSCCYMLLTCIYRPWRNILRDVWCMWKPADKNEAFLLTLCSEDHLSASHSSWIDINMRPCISAQRFFFYYFDICVGNASKTFKRNLSRVL